MRQSQRDVTSATVGSRYRPRNDMAVDSTPERSLSLLLRTSRAADATTGCGPSPRCGVVIIRCKVSSNGLAGSDRRLATPQRLVFARVEDMQDGPDQQRVRGLFPMVALLQRAFGIDQHVRDVLHVAHFLRAAPNLQQIGRAHV